MLQSGCCFCRIANSRCEGIFIAVSPFALIFLWCCVPLLADDDYSKRLPRIAPTLSSNATNTLIVADGFRAELIASEPMVTSPVAIDWDASGRLYVCEMRGYSERRDESISRISVLNDDNNDGIFDRSQIYVDGLKWPTGLFAYGGGLFVGDAPDLLFFRDTNGDGRADERKVVLTGFGHSNVQGLMNSFRWGLDNRIHIATGTVGGQIRKPNQPPSQAINIRGRDIALDPHTGEFRLTSGGGQHGMCFDDWGRKYVSSNSDHIQQIVVDAERLKNNPALQIASTRVSIASDGPQAEVFRVSPVEPWRVLRTKLRVSGAVSGPIEGGGRAAGYFTGATGVTIYRGDQWNSQHRGIAIVGDVGSNLIHRKKIINEGVQRIASRIDNNSEFVASTDIWFRPAQFACGPDGNLTVVDVYREVIEHPKSLPLSIKKHIDLNAGFDRGRLYRIVATDHRNRPTPDLANLESAELVDHLRHQNAWHREKAAQLLYQRQDASVVSQLKRLARDARDPLTRLHSLYVLFGLEVSSGETNNTVEFAGHARTSLDIKTLLTAFSDPNANVRRHAIRLAGRTTAIVSFSEPDRISIAEALAGLADDLSVEVRMELALIWNQFSKNTTLRPLVEIIRNGVHDKWVRLAVLSSLVDDRDTLFSELIHDSTFRSEQAGFFLEKVARQIRHSGSAQSVQAALNSVARSSISDPFFALPIFGALGFETAVQIEEESQRIEKARAQYIGRCSDIACDDEADPSMRLRAISLLRHGELAQVRTALARLLKTHGDPGIQSAAISTLGGFQDSSVAELILGSWRMLPPSARGRATEVLFARSDRVNSLFDAIDSDVVTAAEIPRARWSALLKSKDRHFREAAQSILDRLGQNKPSEVVRRYRKTLNGTGDALNGRQVFRKHCVNCHRAENVGHEVGPNLIAIKSRGAEAILTNILDPNREVNPQYLNYTLLTVDGHTLTGMIAAENSRSITLSRGEGISETVLKNEIETFHTSGASLMPEGFESMIDQENMVDLIAYLMTVGTD